MLLFDVIEDVRCACYVGAITPLWVTCAIYTVKSRTVTLSLQISNLSVRMLGSATACCYCARYQAQSVRGFPSSPLSVGSRVVLL